MNRSRATGDRHARNHRQLLSFSTIALVIAAVAAGCSTHIVIRVKDAVSGVPVADLRIERFRLFGANGIPYNPLPLLEAKATDSNGAVGFANVGSADHFQIERHSPNGLLVKLGRKELRIDPKAGHVSNKGWGCSVWLKRDGWKYSTWALKE